MFVNEINPTPISSFWIIYFPRLGLGHRWLLMLPHSKSKGLVLNFVTDSKVSSFNLLLCGGNQDHVQSEELLQLRRDYDNI
jgi:hypothetical protein